mgnify:CR=1 FL=1|tara:strand:- start:6704 stop:7102 length:399 start_codon:yes stop_codon:yes gene_type:complete
MKELTEEFDIVWKKLRKYDLLPKESGKEAVAERKKIKRGIIDPKNTTIKLLINLIVEMNASYIKQNRRITELSNMKDEIINLKEECKYLQIKLKESRLKEREVMVKPGTDNPPKPLGIYGTPQDPLPCQDDY